MNTQYKRLKEQKVKKTLLSMLLVYAAFLFGGSYASHAYAIEFNDFALDVKALSDGNDIAGVIPVFVIVTYEGAGVDTLTAQNFSTKTDAQIVPTVPAGCSALTLDDNEFQNQGDGIYHLGLRAITTLCSGTYFLPIKVDARPGSGIKASGMTILEVFRFSFSLN